MFSFLHFLEATILLLNALAILNDRRVLRPLGLDSPYSDSAVKSYLSGFFARVRRYLRAFLLVANILIIVLEFIVG